MPNSIIEIRKAVAAYLKTCADQVHYQIAPEGAGYPHVVFDLPNSFDDGSYENFILEVDGWDAPANGDTTNLENIMYKIDAGVNGDGSGLDRMLVNVYGVCFVIYRENRLALLDDDKRLRRRKYVYQVRTFGG